MKILSSLIKVGSTTWHNHFLSLTNASARKELEKFGRAKQAIMMAPADPDIVNLARSSLSFSMVRHPFERIVSAYQDKVPHVCCRNLELKLVRGKTPRKSFDRGLLDLPWSSKSSWNRVLLHWLPQQTFTITLCTDCKLGRGWNCHETRQSHLWNTFWRHLL